MTDVILEVTIPEEHVQRCLDAFIGYENNSVNINICNSI